MLQILIKGYKNIFFYIRTWNCQKYLFKLLSLIFLIAFWGFASTPLFAEENEQTSENPFSGFETIILPNGLKIWYKHLPTDTNVSLSVTVPWGSDQDPIGKEQLAHFTEHMLFSDHLGRTEEQIKKEVEDLGGIRNAFTYSDRTYYFVRIDKKHGLFALEWLYKIISPHEMDEKVVERQREPVAIEVGARKREFFDWIDAYYLNPYWLRPPNFWAREFGEELFPKRDYYPYRSLYQITAKDLRDFYSTYYTPEGMTLTVIGNLDRSEVIEKINNTFAQLPKRSLYQLKVTTKDPERFWQLYEWKFGASISYFNAFKFYQLTQEEHLKAIFISRFLQERLNAKLRYGDRKATYSIISSVLLRGSAAFIQIFCNLKESEYNFGRSTIEEELEVLRKGTLTNEIFEAEKASIVAKLRATHSSAKDLEAWATNSFFDPERNKDFPDLVTKFQNYTKSDIEKFAQQHLVKKRQVLEVDYLNPLNQGVFAFLGVLVVVITFSAARRYLLKPLPIFRIRYIARFRMSPFTRLMMVTLFFLIVAIGGQVLDFFYNWVNFKFILHIENFWIQWSFFTLMGAISLFLFMLLIARFPSKLLLFNDSLAIKYFSYRSKTFSLNDIKEVSLQPFSSVWFSSRIWKCIPLTFALFSPAVYMRLKNGWAYFFQLRDNKEFLTLLKQLQEIDNKSEVAVDFTDKVQEKTPDSDS